MRLELEVSTLEFALSIRTNEDMLVAAFPLQSWLFAKLIAVFQLTGQSLAHAANFWALMFFILALGTAASYGLMGYSSNRFSFVSATQIL